MAADYIDEILSVQPIGPYFLAGYCFGGIVAFEIAQQLRTLGHEVGLLANFNSASPTYVHPSNPIIKKADEAASTILKVISGKISFHFEMLKNLNNKERLLYLYKTSRFWLGFRKRRLQNKILMFSYSILVKIRILAYNFYLSKKLPLPAFLGQSYLLDTDRKYIQAYIPKIYYGNMVIFRSPKIYKDPHIGWTKFIAGGIKTVDIPGTHKERRAVMEEPHVQVLAAELKKHLNINNHCHNL
jgi:thioesterase domain-containing protein